MGGFILKKIRAVYIGPVDPEYKPMKEYWIYPIKEYPDGALVAAENQHGEAYAMPAYMFVPITETEQKKGL